MPETAEGPLYLIDGFAIIFKSYYAMARRPLSNERGENISALLGFVKQVQQILRHARENTRQGAAHVAILLDGGGPTFRHELYPKYKANRDAAPDDLVAQLSHLKPLLELWGLPRYQCSGYEADDLIATLARRASAEKCGCNIVTADKDLYQLIDDRISILKLEKDQIEYHRAAYVIEKWGVEPQQIRDYLAIVGDISDNVPGVKGIGAKGAARLLADYHSMEGIYAHLAEIKSNSMRNKLEESRETAFLSYELVRLEDQLPEFGQLPWDELWRELEVPATAYSGKGAQPNHNFAIFLQGLGLNQIAGEFAQAQAPVRDNISVEGKADGAKAALGEVPRKNAEIPAQPREKFPCGATLNGPIKNQEDSLLEKQSLALMPPKLHSKTANSIRQMESADSANRGQTTQHAILNTIQDATQHGARRTPGEVFGAYECIQTDEELQKWCRRIDRQKFVAIDTETTGLNELSDQLVGISLAIAKHQAAYIPLKINPQNDSEAVEPLLSAELVRRRLAACLGPDVKIIGQNFKFDFKVLANWGLKLNHIYFDTMIAAWLLDSLQPVGMDALAVRYLGIEPIHFKDLVPKAKKGEVQKTFADVPLTEAVPYAAEDADITWQLYECFANRLKECGLETLFFELEMPLVRILGDMELRGIGCERSQLDHYAAELMDELQKLESMVQSLTGEVFNLNSTQQLAQVLFEKLRLPPGKKTKTGYSTDNSTLEKLLHAHPAIAPLLEFRRLGKLYSTYVKSLPEMILARSGRIHTHFSLIGTETGRLSCKDPNLQNIPVKDAAGRRIRSAFQPRSGWSFFSADYSQIELVVLAHLSADPGLCAAFQSGRDIHQQTASKLFHVAPQTVSAEQRRIAKSINFGVIYGMSAFRLSQDLGLSRNDAQSFIEAYFQEFSGVKNFIAQTLARSREQGYVATLAGRRRAIRQLRSNNKNERSHGERMAVNTVVQGSAADIVKRAMILLDAELSHKASEGWQSQMLLQVHDELIFEAPDEERAALQSLVLGIMENACKLDVPLKVNGEWSQRSWGELH